MDNMMMTQPHELRGRSAKSQKYAVHYPPNYIDAELPLDHRESIDRREHRFLKKRRAESHEHYICIVQDDNGTWSVRSSDSLRAVKKLILADALPHIDAVFTGLEPSLDEFKDEKVPPTQLEPAQSALINSRTSTISYPFAVKRPRTASESTIGGPQREARLASLGAAMPASSTQLKTNSGRKKPRRERAMLKIRMDERDKWFEWMQNAFKAIQQIACRSIAKEWIKAIHPKKQSTHPYNGNMPRTSHRSPDRTRPPYWPQHIKHKEPDHIDKTERTNLLTWLLMHTPQPEVVPDKDKKTDKSFTAKDLLAVLEQKQDEFVVPRMEMIRDVIEVRYHLELYEEGGADADATMDVVDYSESSRNGGGKKRKDQNGPTVKTEDDAEVESNDQDDDELSGTAPATNMSDDENPKTSAQTNALDVDMTRSFVSDPASRDDDVQPEQPTHLHHVDSYHSMAANHHGFHLSAGQVEPNHMHLNQHSHVMQFPSHHSLSSGIPFGSHEWSVAPASAPGLNGSFGDGMMMVQTPIPMMDQNQYEGQVALRPRAMDEMATAHSFHDSQHFPYPMDQGLQRSYHMGHMGGPPPNGMHHGFDEELYSGPPTFGARFMS